MKKNRVISLLLAACVIFSAAALFGVPAEIAPARAEEASEFTVSGNELVKYNGSSSFVSVPDGVRVIRYGAFSGNRSVTSVYLPNSVEEISGGAFENCVKLKSVVIGGGSKLSVIGSYAFNGCSQLNRAFAFGVAHVASNAFGDPPKAETEAPGGAGSTQKPSRTPPPSSGGGHPGQEPDSPQDEADEGGAYAAAPVISAWRASETSVDVIWTSVMYATEYELYRSENGGKPALYLTLTDTKYTDEGLDFKNVKAYGYSVRALLSVPKHPEAKQTRRSEEKWVEAFPPPAGVSAWQSTATSATVFWDPVNLATGFEIYRSDSGAEGEFTWIKTLSLADFKSRADFSYTDRGLDFSRNTYCYKLKSVQSRPNDGLRLKSEFSEAVVVEQTITPREPQDIQSEGLVYSITPEGAVVTAYEGSAAQLTIPSKIRNGNREYPVIGIGPNVFRNNTRLKKITLPDTIKYIETAAFAYCSAFIDQ